MHCENARPLVPSYLDGELSEEQAAPLRAHLFDCPGCREVAKGETSLKRWFESARAEPLPVPHGFAARVARRAFAGDPGVLTPAAPRVATEEVATPEKARVLPFVLKLSAIAAGLLFAFSIAIQRESLPSGNELEAQDWSDLPEDWLEEPLDAALDPEQPEKDETEEE